MRRKFKKVSVTLIFALVISVFASINASAEEFKGETFDLVDENSGYKIMVPNFVEIKQVKLESEEDVFEGNVVVMEKPEKNSDGTYTIFKVITTDKSAKTLDSYPGDVLWGQMDNVNGDFSADGSFMYNLKPEVTTEAAYRFDFFVQNENGDSIFSVNELNFMFVDKAGASETVKQDAALAAPTASKVLVNGKEIAFQAYNINDNNYFKLRDLAMVVNGTDKNFEVSWDDAKNAINLESGKAYTTAGGELALSDNPISKEAKPTNSKMYLDGQEIEIVAYNIDGNNYLKLRDIAKAFNIGITWDSETNTIGIDTKIDYKEE
ncbi:stalk domain-containing protein [Paenibacillus sp. FJAT-26967]|uniref:stalk domain-containing protein n=1 Tax=Paenibacillus sp. FJAT-26967 TaxID=1729690 RepID=UPI0008384D8B|nr:stalk domain-containing protein [Paenibacillus sp. FJAT-26967]